MAPKGSAFLYARPEIQPWLMPLVVSWGYESEHPGESRFIDYHEWQGTRDLAAFLTVPAAIEFQALYNWDRVRQECNRLARVTRQKINALTGLEPICPDEDVQLTTSHFCTTRCLPPGYQQRSIWTGLKNVSTMNITSKRR